MRNPHFPLAFLWLNSVVESLHYFKKECILLFSLANALKYEIVSFRICLKISQFAAAAIQDINISEGACLRMPLNQWYLHIDLSLATPLTTNEYYYKLACWFVFLSTLEIGIYDIVMRVYQSLYAHVFVARFVASRRHSGRRHGRQHRYWTRTYVSRSRL